MLVCMSDVKQALVNHRSVRELWRVIPVHQGTNEAISWLCCTNTAVATRWTDTGSHHISITALLVC